MIKRLLLVSAAAVIATSSFAQKVSEKVTRPVDAQIQKSLNLSKEMNQKVAAEPASAVKSPRTSFDTGVYYETGDLLYYGWNEEGRGYGPTRFITPAWSDVKFPYNYTKSRVKPTWNIVYPASGNSYGIEYWGEDNQADSIVTFYGFGTMSSYAMPTMTLGVQDYLPAMDSYYYKQDPSKYYPILASTYDISPLTNYHDHSDDAINYIGWSGFNESKYLFGSGQVIEDLDGDGTDETPCPISQVYQKMGTTLAPLYIENAFNDVLCMVSSSADVPEPLAEGVSLTMVFYNPDTKDVYGTMTLDAEGLLLDESWEEKNPGGYSTEYGFLHQFNAHWANLVEDDFGNLSEEPIVVDGPWAIRIEGLDQEGVNFGLRGVSNMDENPMQPAYIVVDHLDGSAVAYRYSSNLSMFFTFNAMYDKSVIVTEAQLNDGTEIKDLNVFKVSDDGQSISCGSFADLDYVWVKTAAPWYGYDFDENDEFFIFDETNADQEFYYLDVAEGEEYPEWVTSYAADVQDWANDDLDEYGAVYLTFQCEPLPAGVKGRKAELYVYGRGCVSEEPIVLIQGEVEEEEPLAGDANSDGAVNVSDISAVASYILGDAPEAFNEANADANGDSEINVGDISAIAQIILTADPTDSKVKTILAAAEGSATLTLSADEVVAGQEFTLNVDLNNADDAICGVQADIYLPEGLEFVLDEYDEPTVEGGRSSKITTECALQSNGALRILCYSAKNYTYTGTEGAVATIAVKAADTFTAGDIAMKKIVLSSYNNKKVAQIKPADFTLPVGSAPDAINGINATNANAAMFNLAGQSVDNSFRGVVIMNGKKALVK